MSLEYPVCVYVWMDNQVLVKADVDSPAQADHWMRAFMADHWKQMIFAWDGKQTQVVRRNPVDRFDPVIIEVA